MSDKEELARIAAELKSIADRLLDCAKEDKEEEDSEGDSPSVSSSPRYAMMAMKLKSKLGK